MTGEPAEPRDQRKALGSELRRLRTLSGLSGRVLAKRTGISQANVSRIENGQIVPSLPQVRAWAKAVDAPGDAVPALLALTEVALSEAMRWRERLNAGLAQVQRDIREREATTRMLRVFQMAIVPGLLQTPDYARCILSEYADLLGELSATVAIRMERQAVIHDPAHRFEFILTEGALRWLPESAPPGLLAAQHDRVALIAELDNVAIGVIPTGAPMKASPSCNFMIFDKRDEGHPPFVTVDLPHTEVLVEDPADIDMYRRQLSAFRESAVFGRDAVSLIRSLP